MNAKPEPRDCEVMVRYTATEYAKIKADAGDEQIAVYVRRRSLAADADPDPRHAEVTLRSKCGRWDRVVGVYTLDRAMEMVKLHEVKGWTGSIRLVDELPKVGPPLVDVAKLVAEFNAAADFRHAEIAAERLASNPLATKGRKP